MVIPERRGKGSRAFQWLSVMKVPSERELSRVMLESLPMGFNDEDSEGELSQMIEEHGGIVVYPYNEDYKENKIIIRSRDWHI